MGGMFRALARRKRIPSRDPNQSKCAHHHKGIGPSKFKREPRDRQRDQDRTRNAANRAHRPKRKRTVLIAEHRSDGLDIGRCAHGLCGPERSAGEGELPHGPRKGVNYCSDAPTAHAQGIGAAPADPVDQPAGTQQGNRSRKLEYGRQMAIVRVGPVQVFLQHRLEDGDNLTISAVQQTGRDQHKDDQSRARSPH